MRVVRRALFWVSRSRVLARALFGIEFEGAAPGERYFDLTTPVLVRTVARVVPRGSRVLDMGTGLFAAIGLALWKRGYEVTCSDVDPMIVTRAKEAIPRNRARLQVIQSDLFASVEGEFDVVTFNPPYIPSSQLLGGEAFSGQSDGGVSGLDVFERFLLAFPASKVPTAFVGVSAWHLGREKVLAVIGRHERIVVTRIHSSRLPPVDVYELGRR